MEGPRSSKISLNCKIINQQSMIIVQMCQVDAAASAGKQRESSAPNTRPLFSEWSYAFDLFRTLCCPE